MSAPSRRLIVQGTMLTAMSLAAGGAKATILPADRRSVLDNHSRVAASRLDTLAADGPLVAGAAVKDASHRQTFLASLYGSGEEIAGQSNAYDWFNTRLPG
jgi:hypothetical protein